MQQILRDLRQFRDARGWAQYHQPAELARALAIECGELNELFLWGTVPPQARIEDEVADVLIFALNLCLVLETDPEEIIRRKMTKNATKYPILDTPRATG